MKFLSNRFASYIFNTCPKTHLFILKVLSYWNLNAGAIGFMQLMPGLKVLSYWNLNILLFFVIEDANILKVLSYWNLNFGFTPEDLAYENA